MSLKRIQIRKAVQSVLLGKTRAESRVYSNLSSVYWQEEFPAIGIFTRGEAVAVLNTAPREYQRTIELVVEILASGSETPESGELAEDVADQIAEQVELELNRDETFGEIENAVGKREALVDSLELQTVEFDFQGEGVKPLAACRLVYSLKYTQFRPGSLAEQEGVGNLETINAKWKVGHDSAAPDNVVELEDNVSLPQT